MRQMTLVYQLNEIGATQLLPDFNLSLSLNEAQRQLPDGVYTTFRTYNRNKVVRIDDHFQRIEDSAALLGKPIHLDQAGLRHALSHVINLAGFPENRLRLSVDLDQKIGDVYILIEPLTTPSEDDYQNGVSAITRKLHRENPKAKSTEFVQKADTIKASVNGRVYEILMVSDTDKILEGLSSNFFAVFRGEVWTAEEGVLAGVTRGLVFDVLDKLKIPCIGYGLPLGELEHIDEAFITSSSRGVLPLTRVDRRMIGTEKPGPITQAIRTCFNALIAEIQEPISPD